MEPTDILPPGDKAPEGKKEAPEIEIVTVPITELEALRAGGRKLYVTFVFSRGAAQEFGGIYINGLADLRTQGQIEEVSKLILDQIGAAWITLLSWKGLDA